MPWPWPRLRPRSLRIREKLILQFVLVAALTLGLAGLLIIQAARRTLEERIAAENQGLARTVATLIEDKAGEAARLLGNAAASPRTWEALQRRDTAPLEAVLQHLRNDFDLFGGAWILDSQGILVANSPRLVSLHGQSFASREYYREVASTREPFFSPGFRRALPPHSVTSALAGPVTDGRGRLLGVLVAAMDLAGLEARVRRAAGAGQYWVVLLDRTGRALIHPDPSRLLQFPPPEDSGDSRILTSRILLQDLGWTLTVSQPAAVAFGPLAHLELAILWALLVGVGGAMVLAAVVATRFTRPVEALRRDVQALAAPERGERVIPGDELSSLRTEFDRMRARIAEQATVVEARTGALEALLDIASTANASLELDAVLGQALERTMAITGADLGGVRLYDAGRGVLESICTRGDWRRPNIRPEVRLVGEGLSGRAAGSRTPIFMPAEGADLGTLATFEGAHTAAAIPLLARDRLQGTMVLAYRRPHEFTERERQLLAGIGSQIGTAIENARLFRQTRGQAGALQALALVNQQVTTSLVPGPVANMVCNSALSLLRGAYARIWLLEPDGRHLTLGASATAGAAPPPPVTRLPLEGSLAGWVVRERQVRYSPHLADDPLLKEMDWVRAAGYVSQLAAPLLHGEKAVGALLVVTRELRQFSEFERDLLCSLASQAAIALENARLYGEALANTQRLEGLIRTSAKVAGTLQAEEVLRDIAEEAAKLLGVEGAGFRLLEGDRLVVGGKYGLAHQVMLRPFLPVGESLTGRVALEGRPIAVPDLREDQSYLPDHKAAALTYGVVAFLGVPLRSRDRIIGVLNVYDKERRTFREEEISLLSAFADHAAAAIENARLYALSQQRLHRAQALYETGQAVSGILDLRELFELIIAKTAEHLRLDRCALLQFEMHGDEVALVYQVGRGLSTGFTAGFRVRIGEGTTGKAVQVRRPVWTADILNDPATTLSPALRARVEAEGYRAVLSAPILAQGEPIGALVIYRDEVGPFDAEEVEFLQALADQAGLAIHNARLFADLRDQTHRLESLIRVSRLIGTNLELEHLLTAIVRTCTELLGMDAATLGTLDEQGRSLEAQVDYGLRAGGARHLSREPGVGFMGQVLAERRVLISANFAEDPQGANREWARREGLVAAAGVPLLVGDKALGTLAVFKRGPTTFSEADITLLSSFASQAAIAIQNARLFAELKEYSERLEERVRARTAELEAANRAKSQFLANMSHELRTPLNAIIGFSALLEEGQHGPLTEKQRRFVRHVQTSGKHLLAVINDILDLTRVEAGRLELALEPVDLAGVIEEALSLVREGASEKRLTLASEVTHDLPPAVADPVRLRQILYNLLGNAVKFTPEGGTVTVGAERDGEGLAVWVRDTGIGISPEDQERIFREFEQVDNSFSRQYQGAGLGLALTRSLVELHGGRIRVESTPDKGSTFTFTIPRRVTGDVPAAQA